METTITSTAASASTSTAAPKLKRLKRLKSFRFRQSKLLKGASVLQVQEKHLYDVKHVLNDSIAKPSRKVGRWNNNHNNRRRFGIGRWGTNDDDNDDDDGTGGAGAGGVVNDEDVWVEKVFKHKKSGETCVVFCSTKTGRRVHNEAPTGAGRVIYLKDDYRNRILNPDKASSSSKNNKTTGDGSNQSQQTLSSEATDDASTSITTPDQDATCTSIQSSTCNTASSPTTSFERIELLRSQFSKQKGFKAKTRTANQIDNTNNINNINNDTAGMNMNDGEVWVERIYRNKHSGQNTIYFVSSTTGKRVAHYPPSNAKQVLNLTDSFRRLHVRHIPARSDINEQRIAAKDTTITTTSPIQKESQVEEYHHEEYESILSTSITEETETDTSDSDEGLRNSSFMNSSLSLRSSSKRKGLNSTSPVKRMPLRVIGGEVWTERVFRNKKGERNIYFVSNKTKQRLPNPPSNAFRVVYLAKSCRIMYTAVSSP